MAELGQLEREAPLDRDACIFYTERYLRGQAWGLVDAQSLADRLWPALQNQNLRGEAAKQAVETAVWQDYATVLYDSCRRPQHPLSRQAWTELQGWLEKQARSRVSHENEREEVVQETMIRLHDAFENNGLAAPRALWAFALQTLRNTNIDRHRRRTTQKRDDSKTRSLEEHAEQRHHTAVRPLPVDALPGKRRLRPLEDTVINRDRRRQLDQFFERHLSSDLQLFVARSFFLENQTPAQIAALMQKTPHEVRMIKARVLRTLRALPPSEIDSLLEILGAPYGGEEEDHDAGS